MKSFLAVGCMLLISGCAQPQKDIFALDGSRADGLLDIAFQGAGSFDSSDTAKALAIASEKCAAWGYQGASKFGSKHTFCLSSNYFGCVSSQVTMKFQCLGNPNTGYPQPGAGAGDRPAPASTSKQSRDEQVDRLSQESISYEEYQRRYKEIMGR